MFRLLPPMDKDAPSTLIQLSNTFNKFVNPGEGAIRDAACTHIHGLTADSPEIKEANSLFGISFASGSMNTSQRMTSVLSLHTMARLAILSGRGRSHKHLPVFFHSRIASSSS